MLISSPDRRTFRPKQAHLIFPRSLRYLYFAFKQNYLGTIFPNVITEIDSGRKLASLGHVLGFQFGLESTHRYWWLDTTVLVFWGYSTSMVLQLLEAHDRLPRWMCIEDTWIESICVFTCSIGSFPLRLLLIGELPSIFLYEPTRLDPKDNFKKIDIGKRLQIR